MATLVTVALPQEEFVLWETLASVPEATFEVEELVETGEQTIMPLVWAEAADNDQLDRAIREDPTTEDVELLSEYGERWLYRMEWTDSIQLLLEILLTNEAAILEATTSGDQWILRLMFPTHDGVSKTKAYCEDHNIPLEIRSIREMAGKPSGRYGLTDDQYEALTTAWERGYYSVPRENDLDDLAAEMDITHQALSERLRRAVDALVQDTLIVDDRPPDVDREGT